MWYPKPLWIGLSIAALAGSLIPDAAANQFTLEQILARPFAMSCRCPKADRFAWIAYERGLRNASTSPPDRTSNRCVKPSNQQ
jgi:hypothetical protein